MIKRCLVLLLLFAGTAHAAVPTPDAYWDVNVDGRTDDDLYEHVNGTVETSTGAPTVDTSGTYDSLNYNGTDEYTNITTFPTGLSSTFLDSDYTIAVRFKVDDETPSDFQSIFGIFKDGDSNDRTHILLNSSSGIILGAQAGGTGGTDIFLTSGESRTTSQEVVVVMRCDATDCSLWVDGVETDTDSATRPTMGAQDVVGFAARLDGDLGTSPWYFPGHIPWAALWEVALTDEQIQELDDTENPFVTPVCDLTQAETANLNTEPTDALQNCSETPVGIFIGPYHFDAKVGSDTDDIIFDLPPQDELTTNYPNLVVGSGSTAVINTSNSCLQDFTDGSMADECDLSSYFARTGDQCGDDDGSITCVETDDEPLLTSAGLHSVGSYTQLVENSDDFSDSTWFKVRSSISSSSTTLPDGTTGTVNAIQSDATSANTHYIYDNVTLADNSDHNFSVYVKEANQTWVRLFSVKKDGTNANAFFNVSGCSVGTTSGVVNTDAKQVGDWCRVSLTYDSASGGTTPAVWILPAESDGDNTFDGTSIDELYVWGAQVTQSSFALPIVRTAGSTVTADSAIVGPVDLSAVASGWSDPVNGISGHMILSFMRAHDQDTGSYPRILGFGDGTSAETLELLTDAVDPRIGLRKDTNGAYEIATSPTSTHAWEVGEPVSVAFRASSAGIKIWVTSDYGQTVTENTDPDSQADFQAGMSQFYIGAGGDGGTNGDFFKVECFVPYDKAVPDAVLANLGRTSCGY